MKIENDRPSDIQDLSLLRKAAAGDGKAFHALVDRHADRLFRLAASLVGSRTDAEDVLQETFAGAFQGLSGFQGRASVKTWLTRILVMQAAKWRRDRKRHNRNRSDDSHRGTGAGNSIDDEHEARLAPLAVLPGGAGLAKSSVESGVGSRIDVQAALQKLSDEHRTVLVLREFEHLTYEQIAEVLDLPRGTIESRLFRARADLKELLKAYLP